MYCNSCGGSLPEGSRFCPGCGQPVAFPAPVAQPLLLQEDAEGQLSLSGFQPEQQPDVKAIRRKIRWLVAGMAGMITVTAVILLLFLLPLGPMTDIALAAKNTFEEGSVTVDYAYREGLDRVGGTVQLEIDPEHRELTLYAVQTRGDSMFMAIYDGYVITGSQYYSIAYDISQELDQFFDSYESLDEEDYRWQELLDAIREGMYQQVQEHIDLTVLEDCLEDYWDCLNEEDWLQAYAGFWEEKEDGVTCYRFAPDLYTFTYESMTQMKPAFRDRGEYLDLMDELEDSQHDLQQLQPKLAVGILDRELSFLELEAGKGADKVKLRLDFSRIGETRVDTQALQDLLDQAVFLG